MALSPAKPDQVSDDNPDGRLLRQQLGLNLQSRLGQRL
jgi:hypothetical protein